MKAVLDQLYDHSDKNPVPFSVTFCTLDVERKKGGDIIVLANAVVPTIDRLKGRDIPKSTTFGKNPNHKKHTTINFLLPENNRLVKAHIDLILVFNGKTVI